MKLVLAPSAVIRAAAWPIETLDAFGAPDLHDGSAPAGPTEAAYDAAIERERADLWERTVGDNRFMKALLFSSPALALRARALAERRRVRNKRMRHAETSLYRYLARAAARATPGGLWAGVTTAALGTSQRIAPSTQRLHVAPDLAPFAQVVGALAGRDAYRSIAVHRLNPTLERQANGDWHFLARTSGGRIEPRNIEASAGLDSVLNAVAGAGTGTLVELAAASGIRRQVLDDLSRGGALVGGLAFPARFTSAWEALERAESMLVGGDQTHWREASSALRDLAEELAAQLDVLDVDAVARRLDRAREVIHTLGRTFGVDLRLRPSTLRCDLALPLDVALGPAMHRALSETLAAYQREWLDGQSPSSAARRNRRRTLAARLSDRPLALGALFPTLPDAAIDASRQAAWADVLAASDEVLLKNAGPFDPHTAAPWGCLLARVSPEAPTTVVGVDDNPVRALARHASLLGDRDVERWLRDVFSRVSADGVLVADLVVPFEHNPNVLARPELTTQTVEPWGTGGAGLYGARLRERSGTLVLDVPSVGPVAVLPLGSAHVLGADPLAAALALTGFDESGHPASSAASPRDATSSVEPTHTGRVRLSTGAVIRPRQTRLDGEVLDAFVRRPRRSRYAEWRRLAARFDWPEYVAVSIDGAPPVALPASSPLAVEAVFEGVRSARQVVIEEFDTSSTLPSDEGHHVAELAVPFFRTHHAFSS